jgi:hypothetical protein
MTTLMAFSKAARVMMSEGLMSRRSNSMTASPARRQSSTFSADIAVLGGAVGQAHAKRFNGRRHGVGRVHAATGTWAGDGAGFLDLFQLAVIDIAAIGMSAHGFEHGDDVRYPCPCAGPGGWCRHRRTREGRFSRAMAIRQPGMFLSQPPIATMPSKPIATGPRLRSSPQSLHVMRANTSCPRCPWICHRIR